MRRNFLRFATLLLVAVTPSAGSAFDIPPDMWIPQPPPTQILPPDRSGIYMGRGWNHMRYDSVARKFVLFDGYAEPPVYTNGSIYANALWFYDPVQNSLTMEKLNNWTEENGPTEPLPENTSDPTPYNRHSYSCNIYSASKNAFYVWAGANNTIVGNHLGDMWTYDFGTRAWREITSPHPYNVYEQATSYDPFLEKMVLFAATDREYGTGNRMYVFDLETETWTDVTPDSCPAPRMGQNMCFDPERRVTWMFAGADWQSAGNELWTYDAAANVWTRIPQEGPWPPVRRFAHLARDSRHDILLMWGGITASNSALTDTWVFRPSTRTWEEIFPAESPTVPVLRYSTDLDYDPENDFFVLNYGGVFWLYRYSEEAVSGAGGGGGGAGAPGMAFRVASANPTPASATFTFSLTRPSAIRLDVFDASGRIVDTVAEGAYGAGAHTARWAGRSTGGSAASGVYFARFSAEGRTLTRRCVVLR